MKRYNIKKNDKKDSTEFSFKLRLQRRACPYATKLVVRYTIAIRIRNRTSILDFSIEYKQNLHPFFQVFRILYWQSAVTLLWNENYSFMAFYIPASYSFRLSDIRKLNVWIAAVEFWLLQRRVHEYFIQFAVHDFFFIFYVILLTKFFSMEKFVLFFFFILE